MTNSLENCTENGSDFNAIENSEKLTQKQDFKIDFSSALKLYYLIQVDDPEFKLTAKSARKNGVKAEFCSAGWVYQNKNEAEEIAKRWTQGKRNLRVVAWYDPRLDDIWNGSKDEAHLARKLIQLEIHSDRLNKKRQKIILQCHCSKKFHPSWLHAKPENVPEDLKKEYDYFKPLWDKTFEEGNEIDLRASDIKREIEDFEENSQRHDIFEYLSKNEIGDAELFVKLFNEKYLFDPTEGKEGIFYFWNGRSWNIDLHKERYKDFECVAKAYLNAKKTIKFEEPVQEHIEKRACQLRTSRRRKSVFDTVSALVSFKEKWDYIPYKLPCANGIIDLKTGKLTESHPNQFIKKVCPVNYNPNAKCPNFEKFLKEITLNRHELESFLARLFGYAILGVPKEEKVFYLWGKGRNGKGTLIQSIQNALGSFARTFPSEMLLIQRNPPSSSSPNPEKANLEGVRLAIFSEINEGRKIDSAEVKNLSGRDIISCRRLFSNLDLQIVPTHTLILQTNYKPKAPSDDIALWSRNFLIPFEADFTKTANENLKEELFKEAEGILKWLVDGCLEYQKEGLKIPKIVLDQTERYRKDNDGIGCFLEEMCVQDSAFTTGCGIMEQAIKDFCLENGHNVPKRHEISTYLKERFERDETKKGNFWKGVSIRPSSSNDNL